MGDMKCVWIIKTFPLSTEVLFWNRGRNINTANQLTQAHLEISHLNEGAHSDDVVSCVQFFFIDCVAGEIIHLVGSMCVCVCVHPLVCGRSPV